MKALACGTSALLIMAILAAPLSAQETKKKNRQRKGRSPVMALLGKVELTDEQKPKVEAIAKEFDPKLQALTKASNEVLTAEQKAARADAQKQNKEDGLKGKKARQAVEAALNLTEEQKKKMAEIDKQRAEIMGQLRPKLTAILTAEQLEQAPQLAGRKGKKKNA